VTYRLTFVGILLVLIGVACFPSILIAGQTDQNVAITVTHTGTPTITVNNGAAVTAGATVPVSVTNGTGDPGASMALCTVATSCGNGVTDWSDWEYLNCTKTEPTTGLTSATCNLTAFSSAGSYFADFLASNTNIIANVPFTVTGGSSGGNYPLGTPCSQIPGSMCPPGQNWTLVFDDEFNGAGPVDQSLWAYTAESYGAYNPIEDCATITSMSGGLLSMAPVGTNTVYQGQAHVCDLYAINPASPAFPSRFGAGTGNIFFEVKWSTGNQQWSGPFTSGNATRPACNDGSYTQFEVDIPETTQTGVIQSNGCHGQYPGLQVDWPNLHIYGFDWEATTGYFVYYDGTLINGPGLPVTWNGLAPNPDGCSVSTPCTGGGATFIMQSAPTSFPAQASHADWVRIYSHP
jgi:hypothetical protein